MSEEKKMRVCVPCGLVMTEGVLVLVSVGFGPSDGLSIFIKKDVS